MSRLVKCIDNKGVENFISIGEVYEVVMDHGLYLLLRSEKFEVYDYEVSFLKSDFEEVKDE